MDNTDYSHIRSSNDDDKDKGVPHKDTQGKA